MRLRKAAQLWVNTVAVIIATAAVIFVPVAGGMLGAEAGHAFLGVVIALFVEVTIAAAFIY